MSKIITIDSLNKLDYSKIGLKCGLEIHQQLNTGKLFCNSPCEIVPNDQLDKEIKRYLRFSQSETGEVDKVAEQEFRSRKLNTYKYNDRIACLVELDEEPPTEPNKLAFDAAFKVGTMLNVKFFDKVQFMRKIIIDGSVTTGFQRTALLGICGSLKTPNVEVTIEGVNIEEDSCRTIERKDNETIFALDRQGIPLIEITTGPQIKTPNQAQEVAKELGNILRSLKETKRGLGTIRQDLNVSIENGSRVEIKGAQNLKLIPDIVEAEAKRQLIHLSILEELKSKKTFADNFSDFEVYDITNIMKKSESKVIKSNLSKENSGVFAVKLFNMKGILGTQLQENHRFATEISDRNKKRFHEIKGLFHLDEMPNYGITQAEVDNIIKQLKMSKEDNFIMLVARKELATESLNYILEIIADLLTEVPSEVRQVDPKGTLTKFLRAMPGAARMYPETDVREIEITKEYKQEIKNSLPELYNTKLNRLEKNWTIEKNKVEEILDRLSEEQVENLLKLSQKNANILYSILFEIPKDIKKRENIEPIDFKYELLESLLEQVSKNDLSLKVIRDLFVSLYNDNLSSVSNLEEYIKSKNLVSDISDDMIEIEVKKIIESNKGAPFGALMGHAMKAFEGKVDGKKLSSIIKKLM